MKLQKTLSAFFFTLTIATVSAQLSSKEEQSIDSIFIEWNSNKPGMAAGLIYGNEIQYLKGFGIADIETNRAIDPKTKFQIDHLSRQFTVLSILLLEKMEKLAMNDPVQKFIPELPTYQHKLTIGHLVNHTSGLNDYEILKLLLGKEEDDVFTHKDAMHLIRTQKTLNFKPGTKFSYLTSKTELTLLAEVITKASGESLTVFSKKYIFAPLQMNNSTFVEDYNSIIPNVANSYQTEGDTLKKEVLNLSNAGPTNLYTTAEDLLAWYKKLTLPIKKPSILNEAIKKLDQLVKLDNGTTYNSSWGQMTLGRSFYHLERGLPAYWQYGLVGGYGTNVFRFPEQDLTSFVMGNNNSYNGMPAMMMATHFIEDKFPEPSTVDPTKIKSRKVTTSELQTYEGDYWNAERALARRFFVENDTLFYTRPGQDQGLATIPLKQRRSFQLQVESDDVIIFSFSEENGKGIYDIKSGIGDPYRYKKYEPITYTEEELNHFEGNFYNEQLNSVYTFKIEDNELVVSGPENSTATFFPVVKNVFRSSAIQFGSIIFARNQNGNVTGFQISTDGIQNLFFTKINNS
ncbi:beta-lactamase family protein [Flagellimonas sp. HMM57]|uniref:serine hydrolase domain-containing protein n=1 Tax=unclassified Flagellimonas TaxID=2644544 RepID=UPI0013D54693|nr:MULTISPECIES: serine hydrolase domain-containing protein [unclassified Flagellimonas]UII76765.1 beta-lactamase family protein [Flagellimonas sp. HMM57]